jgi:hypothetical protein
MTMGTSEEVLIEFVLVREPRESSLSDAQACRFHRCQDPILSNLGEPLIEERGALR